MSRRRRTNIMNSDELNSSSQNEAYPMMEDMEEDMVDMDDDEDDDDDLEDTDDMGGADGNMEDYAATRRSSPPAAAAAATRHIAARNLRGSSNNNRGGHGSNSCNVNRREVTTNHQPFTTRSSASNATFIPFEVEDSVIALATEEAAEESQTASFSGADSNARNDPATAKRRAIQAIMKDRMLTEREKGLRIHQLMDGRPTALSCLDRTNRGTGGHYNTVLSGLASDLGVDGDSDAAVASMVTPGLNEAMTCVHYERKCCVVAPCCNQVFGCRVCHDEMTPAPGHGQMDRFAIQEIVCKECKTRQTSKTNTCINCGITFAEYHCALCNLWMSQSKKPFHCPDCGFCRVGGRDSYRHCQQCCMCISQTVFDGHNCMKDKYKDNCPVCREDMFSSRQSPQDLPCGHAIHAHCFRKLAGFDYRCPICKKTVVSQASMAAAWAARARDIELQPMPPDLRRVVNIMCNDCETKSVNRSWHFLGVQCPNCCSFNTVVENLVRSGDTREVVGGAASS